MTNGKFMAVLSPRAWGKDRKEVVKLWSNVKNEQEKRLRPSRIVSINGQQGFQFGDNIVRTSRYNLLTFLPLFLMESFDPRSKIANVYFLFVGVLQCIRPISNTFGLPTVYSPLFVVILIDAIFKIIEDVERHKSDAEANARKTMIYNDKTHDFEEREWNEIKVGDFIKIHNRESIPADCLIFTCYEKEDQTGICYVETKSLDGETNLKMRQSVISLIGKIQHPHDLSLLTGIIEMEHPNNDIHSFSGALHLSYPVSFEERIMDREDNEMNVEIPSRSNSMSDSGLQKRESDPQLSKAGSSRTNASAEYIYEKELIQVKNLLLRGCTLRNTRWVIALVINTGKPEQC